MLCFELLYLLSKLLPNGFGNAFAINKVCKSRQSQQGFIPTRSWLETTQQLSAHLPADIALAAKHLYVL